MYSKFDHRRAPRPINPRPGASGAGTSGAGASGAIFSPSGVPSYRQRVRVPPNYSGLAIVDGEERLPGTEPASDAPHNRPEGARPEDTLPESIHPAAVPTDALPDNRDFGHDAPPEPRFDDLAQVSELPRRALSILPAASPAPPASQSAGLFDAAHFPFGHGLGSEEWLIIGLILLLLHEAGTDRGDLDETVILLGLLLLGG